MFGRRPDTSWQQPSDDGRGKVAVAAVALAAALLSGVLIDQARSCSSASAGTTAAPAEQRGQDAAASAESGSPAAQGQDGQSDAQEIAGITFTHASRLRDIDAQTRIGLASAARAWMAARSISADSIDVTADAEADQASVRVRMSAAGIDAEAAYDGAWTVTDQAGGLTIDPASTQAAGTTRAVSLADRDGLALAVGGQCAQGLPQAWDEWASSAGVAADEYSTDVDASSVTAAEDGSVRLTLMSGGSRWSCAMASDGTFQFGEVE